MSTCYSRFFRCIARVLVPALLAVLASCAPKAVDTGPARETEPDDSGTNTAVETYWSLVAEDGVEYVADKQGNRVLVAEYRRIIVISPGAVETFYLLGAESAIAAIPESREGIWPQEKTGALKKIGNAARPDLEGVIALEPDLILGNAMNAAFISDLVSRGYHALIHGADSIDDIFTTTLLLGTLTGKRTEAEALVAEKEAILAALAESLGTEGTPLKGAFLYSVNPVMAFTEHSLPGEILTLLDTENIAAGLPTEQPILSSEYLLAENPDFLFGAMSITSADDILGADSVIRNTRAGMEGNISVIPSAMFLRPSLRLVDSLVALNEQLRHLR